MTGVTYRLGGVLVALYLVVTYVIRVRRASVLVACTMDDDVSDLSISNLDIFQDTIAELTMRKS